MRFDRWVFAACAAATLAACGGGNDSGNSGSSLNVQLIGLENLGASSLYETWLIVNGAAKSAGRFTVDHRGSMSQTTFKIDSADIAGSSAYVLTIEPQNDTDLGPTKTHLLAGNF